MWLKFSWNSFACRVSCTRYSLLWLTVTRLRFCTEIWNQAMCWLIIPKGWSSWRISVWLESLQMTCYILRRYIDWEGTFLFWFVVSSLFLMFWYTHSVIKFHTNTTTVCCMAFIRHKSTEPCKFFYCVMFCSNQIWVSYTNLAFWNIGVAIVIFLLAKQCSVATKHWRHLTQI